MTLSPNLFSTSTLTHTVTQPAPTYAAQGGKSPRWQPISCWPIANPYGIKIIENSEKVGHHHYLLDLTGLRGAAVDPLI